MKKPNDLAVQLQKINDDIVHRLRDIGIGLALADEHGAVFSGGFSAPKEGKRFFVVLATNDAAIHLQKWADEQVDGRIAAGKKVGLKPVTGNKPGGPEIIIP